ncbi:MAG: hypothetical protein AAF138_06680 [Planctomycetota bacterium]
MALVLGALTLASVGVLPGPGMVSKVLMRWAGERYPCEGSACGCASARACWTSCRCHTMSAKLAWAAREGVDVPDYAQTGQATGTRGMMAAAAAARYCPLCPADDPVGSDEHAELAIESDAGPGGLGRTEMAPMGCGGRDGLIVLAPVLGLRGVATAERNARPRVERVLCDAGRGPGVWALSVEPPPPKTILG